jgi:ubiquitin
MWFGEDSLSKKPFFKGQSTKANVEKAMHDVAARSKPGDQVVLVLIGHGSGEAENSKISIPGPDLSAGDFARLLGEFSAQKVAFVNLTSASGDMLPILSAPNRVIITATKSAFERNESHFAQFFVDAFAKDVADTDKDGRISLLEAFRYAVAETKRVYETDTKLQTEHAQLEDAGAKTGVADPDGRTTEGLLARRFFLDAGTGGGGGGTRLASNDPQLAALYKDKYAIEEQIDQLRTKKASMSADAYDDALEALLIQLARKAKTIRELEGRKS